MIRIQKSSARARRLRFAWAEAVGTGSVWTKAVTILAATLAMMSAPAHAQATESSDASAFLVTPLSFIKQADLDFGTIIPSDTDGAVFMDSAGVVTTSGGVIALPGTQLPARFWGFGELNQTVLINVDQNTYTLTRVGGTETMLYDQVTIGSRPPILITTNPRRFRIANPDGFFTFTIAGRLRVAADQAAGVYEGQFSITLEYE